MNERVAAILAKHWLDDGTHEGDPAPLTADEVSVLCDELPDEYAAEDFEDRGDGKMWHTESWYDFRGDEWFRDEYGKVY